MNTLKQFSDNEIVLDENEARIVLKFIFKAAGRALIETLPPSRHLREFAQAC